MSSDNVTLRPVVADDENLLLELYASTRMLELAATGWDPAQQEAFVRMQFSAQREYYATRYPQGEHQIIILEGQPVGRLYTAETEDEIRILDVTVLPARRSAGIGSRLIEDLLARAQKAIKPVRIYVETYNRSLGLFERMGFTKIEEDGLNVLLEWRPRA
jgi:ribosomal protein S18 acetylase RimI-like enzyme